MKKKENRASEKSINFLLHAVACSSLQIILAQNVTRIEEEVEKLTYGNDKMKKPLGVSLNSKRWKRLSDYGWPLENYWQFISENWLHMSQNEAGVKSFGKSNWAELLRVDVFK